MAPHANKTQISPRNTHQTVAQRPPSVEPPQHRRAKPPTPPAHGKRPPVPASTSTSTSTSKGIAPPRPPRPRRTAKLETPETASTRLIGSPTARRSTFEDFIEFDDRAALDERSDFERSGFERSGFERTGAASRPQASRPQATGTYASIATKPPRREGRPTGEIPTIGDVSAPRRLLRVCMMLSLLGVLCAGLVMYQRESQGEFALKADDPTPLRLLAAGRPESLAQPTSSPLGSSEPVAPRHRLGELALVAPAPNPGSAADQEPAEAESTGEWVEPDLGPESTWIDSGNGVMVPDLQLRIRFCESTNNYRAANSGSSARGAYQFLAKSWDWYGHAARTGLAEAHLATPAQQDQAALHTLQEQGARPWAESQACWRSADIDPRYRTAKPIPAAAAPVTTEPESVDTTTPDGETDTTEEGTTETTASEEPTSTEDESTTSVTEPEQTDTSQTDTTAPSGEEPSEPTDQPESTEPPESTMPPTGG